MRYNIRDEHGRFAKHEDVIYIFRQETFLEYLWRKLNNIL